MRILVGHTGLVGETLKSQADFDFFYNSKNIDTFGESFPDGCDLYLTCLPSTKWMINQSLSSRALDYNNCLNIVDILSKRKYNKIVVISTIDVYLGSEFGCNEDHQIQTGKIGYGENRLIFEKLIKKELQYESLKIYRLPALFGKGLKKNILFDILNNNNLDSINKNSYYQWYSLDRLWSDINLYEEKDGSVINLFTEPVFTKDIIDNYFDESIGFMSDLPITYNYKTKFFDTGYIDTAENVLKDILRFINENRS